MSGDGSGLKLRQYRPRLAICNEVELATDGAFFSFFPSSFVNTKLAPTGDLALIYIPFLSLLQNKWIHCTTLSFFSLCSPPPLAVIKYLTFFIITFPSHCRRQQVRGRTISFTLQCDLFNMYIYIEFSASTLKFCFTYLKLCFFEKLDKVGPLITHHPLLSSTTSKKMFYVAYDT